LRGDLIKNRTVILVAHNVSLTAKIADFVVSVTLDGRASGQSSISDALANDEVLAMEVSKDQEIFEASEKEIDAPPAADKAKEKTGKLIVAEEIPLGHVSWKAWNLYFAGMGGGYTIMFFAVLLITILVIEANNTFQTWFLGYWARYVSRPCVFFR
jgi:hypothetical protein